MKISFPRIALTILALAGVLPSPVVAGPPANTAAAAGDAVSAFLPAQVKPTPLRPLDLPDSGPLPDLTGPAAAVHQALTAALVGLTANQPDTYAAVLDTDYTQPATGSLQIDKGETVRRLRGLLTRNQCAEAALGIADFRLDTPVEAHVLVRERLSCLSRNTPPTRMTTSDGRVALINNTSTLTATLLLSQTWVRHGTAWRLKRSETIAAKMTAVL